MCKELKTHFKKQAESQKCLTREDMQMENEHMKGASITRHQGIAEWNSEIALLAGQGGWNSALQPHAEGCGAAGTLASDGAAAPEDGAVSHKANGLTAPSSSLTPCCSPQRVEKCPHTNLHTDV